MFKRCEVGLNMIMEQSSIKRINILERALLFNEISNEFLEYIELCEDGRLNSLNDELIIININLCQNVLKHFKISALCAETFFLMFCPSQSYC